MQNGIYRFELRHYPREEPRPIEAIKATVEIGEEKTSNTIGIEATNAVIEMELKKGLYDMVTTFHRPTDFEGQKEWGSYYVYVDYLGKQ